LKGIANWKAPGLDEMHAFWIEKFTKLNGRISQQLQQCLIEGNVPEWMVLGRTNLAMKDETKGAEFIACLPTTFKLLMGVMPNANRYVDILTGMVCYQMNRRDVEGTHEVQKDQLLIDKMVLKNCRRRRMNLNMAWIDYKKAYDMVPYSWILESVTLMGIADNIKRLLKNSTSNWKTNAYGTTLGEVNIRRGIFQGDSLSPLLFVIAIISLRRMLRH